MDQSNLGFEELNVRIRNLSFGKLHSSEFFEINSKSLLLIQSDIQLFPSDLKIIRVKGLIEEINIILRSKKLETFYAYEFIGGGDSIQEMTYTHLEDGLICSNIIRDELIYYRERLLYILKLADPNFYMHADRKPKLNLSVAHIGMLIGILWKAGIIDEKSILKKKIVEFICDNFSSLETNDLSGSAKALSNATTSAHTSEKNKFINDILPKITDALQNFKLDNIKNSTPKKRLHKGSKK